MEKGKGMEEEEYSDEDAKLPPRMYRPDIPLVWAERRRSYKSPYTFEEQIRYNTERGKPYFNADLLPGRPEPFFKYPREPFVESVVEPTPRDEYLKMTANDPPRRRIHRKACPIFENNVHRAKVIPEQDHEIVHLLRPKGGRAKVLSKSNGTVRFEPITSFEVTVVRYSFDSVANKPVVEILKPATPITDLEIPKPATPITNPMLLEDAAASASSGGTKPEGKGKSILVSNIRLSSEDAAVGNLNPTVDLSPATSGTKPEVKGRFGLKCPNEDLDLGSGKDVITNLNPLAYSSVETGATSGTYAEAGDPLDQMLEGPILKRPRKAVFENL